AFVPAGALLVMAPADVDSARAVSDDSTAVSLAAVGDDRELWIYPGGSSSWQEAGGLEYELRADDMTAAPAGATFEGEAIELTVDGDWLIAELVGPGTLRYDDGSTLVIA